MNRFEQEKYVVTTSLERIMTFANSDTDTEDEIISRYNQNIQISQALYPELSILEITLRNTIDTVFQMHFGINWLENEITNNILLDSYDYNTLLKSYNSIKKECENKSKNFSRGKVIANLNFGFWTNLCLKKYNTKIWTKKGIFKSVFVNYPSNKQQQIHYISTLLNSIRKLRNRVFHYEIILKDYKKLLEKYNEILEVLNYLPQNNPRILKETSIFLNTYNKIINTKKTKT